MSESKRPRTTAIYITSAMGPNRGAYRYMYSLLDKCGLDEKRILYINDASPFPWIRGVLKSIKENLNKDGINVIFIRGAPILDSLGPIIFRIFFGRNVKLVAPIFHLNPLSLWKNGYNKFLFILSLMQRTGAFLELLFADVFITENTYIERYIHKFRKNGKVIVRQLGIRKEYIPSIDKILNADRDIDFIYTGGLDKLKGVEDILIAFKPISKDHSLVLAGYGDRKWIEKLIEKYEIDNVEIYSNISEEEKFKLYLRSKVYVFSSLADGIPITFHEAWAYGNLVVARLLPTYDEIKDRIFGVSHLDPEKMIYALSSYNKQKELITRNYWYAVKNANTEENVLDVCSKICSNLNLKDNC